MVRSKHGFDPLVHFLAAAALVLNGRLAATLGLVLSGAGALLAVSIIGAILSFGAWEVAGGFIPWLLFLCEYVAAAVFIARSERWRNWQLASSPLRR